MTEEEHGVRDVVFLRRLAWFMRWDVSVFAIVYSVLAAMYWSHNAKVLYFPTFIALMC